MRRPSWLLGWYGLYPVPGHSRGKGPDMCTHKLVLARIANWTAIGVSSTSGTPSAFDVRGRSPHKRYLISRSLGSLWNISCRARPRLNSCKPVTSGKNLNHDAKLTWIVKTLFLVQESSPLFKFSSAYRTVIATVCMSVVRRWKVCVTGSFPPPSLDKWLIPLNMAWKNSASHVKPSGDSQVFLKGP